MATPNVLTRRELYDLVWSKPMTDLAEEFGLSDRVSLVKTPSAGTVPMNILEIAESIGCPF